MSRAFSPERRMVAMAPIPGEVAMAQMVNWSSMNQKFNATKIHYLKRLATFRYSNLNCLK